ncbi:MAG: hypothetical protein AABZ49_00795, partial [Thermoproteota archaeon]
EIVEDARVVDFSSGSLWYQSRTAEIFLNLENLGTIHIIPRGLVRVKNWRGKQIAVVPINNSGHFVLAKAKWSENFPFSLRWRDIGPLSASLELHYGLKEKRFSLLIH